MLEIFVAFGTLFVIVAPIISDARKAQEFCYDLSVGWEWCDEIDASLLEYSDTIKPK